MIDNPTGQQEASLLHSQVSDSQQRTAEGSYEGCLPVRLICILFNLLLA